jgi:hypothetical protein
MSIESIEKRLDACHWIGSYIGGTPGVVLTGEQERLLLEVVRQAKALAPAVATPGDKWYPFMEALLELEAAP